MNTITVEPAARPLSSWRAELGSLKARGLPDDDESVLACRAGLAYWKVRAAVDTAKDGLSPAGVDSLVALLLGLGVVR